VVEHIDPIRFSDAGQERILFANCAEPALVFNGGIGSPAPSATFRSINQDAQPSKLRVVHKSLHRLATLAETQLHSQSILSGSA
jgi:hypothetical protein